MTLTIFQAGNSAAMTIPHDLLKEMGLKVGQKVEMNKMSDAKKLVVSPVEKISEKTGLTLEFKKWLSGFLEEDGKLLDELENR